MDEIEFAAQFRPPAAGSATEVLARRLATPDLDELADAAAAKAAADARARQREELLLANRASGDPLGQVSRYQAAVSELRGEVLDLEGQLEAARGRLNRAAENLVHWSEQAEEIRTAVARRSDTADLLGPAKAVLAGHQQFVSATRAAFAAAQAGTPQPARRPFGGEVRRSEVTCEMCLKYGATPEQSFLIHQDPAPETPPAVPSEGEREWLDSLQGRAERRTYGYAEIAR